MCFRFMKTNGLRTKKNKALLWKWNWTLLLVYQLWGLLYKSINMHSKFAKKIVHSFLKLINFHWRKFHAKSHFLKLSHLCLVFKTYVNEHLFLYRNSFFRLFCNKNTSSNNNINLFSHAILDSSAPTIFFF